MSVKWMVLALALAGLPGCRAWSQGAGEPAVIIHPTAASRADLERAVSQALGGGPVRLAGDALMNSPRLIVGHEQPRDVHGRPLNGRELGRPQHFRLLRRGAHCALLHEESGKARVLAHTTCRVLHNRSGRMTPKTDILRLESHLR